MNDELRQCLLSSERSIDGSCVFRFRFPPTLTGFQGHFPGAPVLPGVCTIQAAILAAEADCGQKLRLSAIRSAKFFAFVTPGEEVEFVCNLQPLEHGAALLKSAVRCGGRRIAELSLHMRLPGGRP